MLGEKTQVSGDKEKGEAAKAKKLARPLQIVGEASQVTARGSVSPHARTTPAWAETREMCGSVDVKTSSSHGRRFNHPLGGGDGYKKREEACRSLQYASLLLSLRQSLRRIIGAVPLGNH